MRSRFSPAIWLFFLFTVAGCSRQDGGEVKKAPDFTLPGISGAGPVTLSESLADSPVLLVFWATWCPACVEEIPALNDWQAKRSSDFRLLAVNVQESEESVEKFVRKKGVLYSVLLDKDGDVASRYGLVGLPAAVLVDKSGEILYYGFSLPSNLDQLLEQRRS